MIGSCFHKIDCINGIQDFIYSDLNSYTALSFFSDIHLGSFKELYEPSSAYNLLFIKSKTDYSFSSDELRWICDFNNVLSFVNSEMTLFFAGIQGPYRDNYINCAALIKIFDFVFPGDKVFAFKFTNSVSFGKAIHNSDESFAGFVLSEEFCCHNYEEFSDFIADFLYYGDDVIGWYSFENSIPLPPETFGYDSDYKAFLEEIHSSYGIDVSYELTRYNNSLKSDDNYMADYYYRKAANKVLEDIFRNTSLTSLDYLEKATIASEKTSRETISINPVAFDEDEFESFNYSKEAFLNAETMLKEMK